MEALLNRGFDLDRSGNLAAESRGTIGAQATAATNTKAPEVGIEVSHAPQATFDWLVQLGGAFRSPYPVRRVLNSALLTDPRSLKSARPIVVRLRRGGYLARFSNLTEAQAQGTCQALRDRGFTCSVLRDPSSE